MQATANVAQGMVVLRLLWQGQAIEFTRKELCFLLNSRKPLWLVGAGLSGAVLAGAGLAGANLREANLSGSILIGANLGEADLTGPIS